MADRRTKEQLLRQLEEVRAVCERDVARLEADVAAWRKVAPNDAEAKAIAQCILGLDALKSSAGSHSTATRADGAAVGRVLRYLADRYGLGS